MKNQNEQRDIEDTRDEALVEFGKVSGETKGSWFGGGDGGGGYTLGD